ncbi:MAG: DUF4440 domain-containing protein [Acidobacteriota bacterium]
MNGSSLPRLSLTLGLAVTLLSACAAPTVDLSAEEEAVRAVQAQWLALQAEKDAPGVASLFEEGGALYWENEPIARGRSGIESLLAQNYAFATEGEDNSWGIEEILLAGSGDLAVEVGTYSSGAAAGRYATIHRKVSGEWKIHSDFSVANAPSGGAPEWAIESLRQFYDAYNSGDAEAMAAQYAPDAVVGDTESVARGREAIVARFQPSWDAGAQCNGDIDEFLEAGPIATASGRDVCTVTAADGSTTTTRVQWVSVYEQQSDGSWLTIRDGSRTVGG